MNTAEKMDRNINLFPWENVSITTNYEHHTLIEKASIIINNGDDYFYLHDDIEKIKDVSLMPPYIKEDWIKYNKKELDMITMNIHIKQYEDRLKSIIESKTLPFNLDNEKDLEETIQLLKSLRRELIIKGII
jgi:hypothetical protein